MRYYALGAILALAAGLQAAMLHGHVQDTTGNPLANANVVMLNSTLGASTDLDGKFMLHHVPPGSHSFEISSLGYTTLIVELDFEPTSVLEPTISLVPGSLKLQDLTVQGEAPTGIRQSGSQLVEHIGTDEIQSVTGGGGALELLGGVTGVDSKPCALCGSAGVGLQGLDPGYTEIQLDGLPVMSGLGSLYGVEAIRGQGLAAAELKRGTSDSGQAGDAVAGSVNLLSRELTGADTLALALSLGDGFRNEISLMAERKLLALPSRLELGWSGDPQRLDRNHDDLTDAPQQGRFNLRFSQQATVGRASWIWNLRMLDEHRFAGDVDWKDEDQGSTTVYGRDIAVRRGEAMLRGSWNDASGRRWNLAQAFTDHHQDSWYGSTHFDATQQRYLLRASVEDWAGAWQRKLELGYTHDDYADNLNLSVETDRLDKVPHLALSAGREAGKLRLDGGLRVEHHQDDGIIPLGRASIRWQANNELSLLAGAGQAYRPVTLFSLDKAVHAGFDGVQLGRELQPEKALSLQLALNHERVGKRARFQSSLRLFATEFRDKAILAYVEELGLTEYSNASKAFSRGVSMSHSQVWYSGWRFDASGSFNHVRYQDERGWHEEHMVNRWTAALGLAKAFDSTTLSAKLRINGPQALPAGRSLSESPVWSVLDLGASHSVGRLGLGLYIDNALDYVQPDDPFIMGDSGELLDSAMIYGPLVGRRFRVQVEVGW
jgi:outer membrane receptor for ferrienterochelin and colicins